MSQNGDSRLPQLVRDHEAELLQEWLVAQNDLGVRHGDLIRESEAREQSSEFLQAFAQALQRDSGRDIQSPAWGTVREVLDRISRSRALRGFTPSQTATFIFSLKSPLFRRLREALGSDVQGLTDLTWEAGALLDQLGLHTTESYIKAREEVVIRQQEELLELSTPVVKLWDGILALPVIGTLDSARTQVVMESLLEMIVTTGSEVAIIDITGVPTVDTLVAQHLLKTITAARLMGADCIISGIRPQIAQTIVHLGVDLQDVTTKATLADAFAVALKRTGSTIGRVRNRD